MVILKKHIEISWKRVNARRLLKADIRIITSIGTGAEYRAAAKLLFYIPGKDLE